MCRDVEDLWFGNQIDIFSFLENELLGYVSTNHLDTPHTAHAHERITNLVDSVAGNVVAIKIFFCLACLLPWAFHQKNNITYRYNKNISYVKYCRKLCSTLYYCIIERSQNCIRRWKSMCTLKIKCRRDVNKNLIVEYLIQVVR